MLDADGNPRDDVTIASEIGMDWMQAADRPDPEALFDLPQGMFDEVPSFLEQNPDFALIYENGGMGNGIPGDGSTPVIPLPASAWLMLAGLGALAMTGRHRRRPAPAA